MPFELLNYYLRLPVFLMIAARLFGMIMFQPVLGAKAVPGMVRLLMILALALLLSPFVSFAGPLPDTVLGLVLALAGEVLIGALIGLVAAIALVGVQMGGMLIALESGLAFGQVADPTTNETSSVLSTFYVQVLAVVYLIVGGHRALVAACLDTFETVPLLAVGGLTGLGTDLLVDTLTVGGIVAIRVAAPAVLSLFLVNAALGFLSRTVPQLNIATVGFALKGLIGFVIMAIALPSALAAFLDGLQLSLGCLHAMLGG
ncbi:MAG: flagellar biosynthetic protein FliR [Phycisphaerae bacterium]|jgi:flagellar biosynthetic protein FliR